MLVTHEQLLKIRADQNRGCAQDFHQSLKRSLVISIPIQCFPGGDQWPSFFRRFLSGADTAVNPSNNRLYQDGKPRKLSNFRTVVGLGKSRMDWTLSESAAIPSKLTVCPRYLRSFLQKLHFSGLGFNPAPLRRSKSICRRLKCPSKVLKTTTKTSRYAKPWVRVQHRSPDLAISRTWPLPNEDQTA